MSHFIPMRPMRRMRGVSLIELLVSLAIGAVLVLGATQLYVNSRNSYQLNEQVSRLQENARYAMSVLEPDMRMANYYGLVKGGSLVNGKATQAAAAAPIASGVAANACGTNFAVDLNTTLQGDNNGYVLSASRTAGCDTLSGWTTDAVGAADTLIVRRASSANTVTAANRLQICSTRTSARVYSNGAACAGTGQVNDLIVHAYYIDNDSERGTGVPSLRRKALGSVGGTIQFLDQEVISGVEDMQVQFGVDPTGLSGIVTRYVDPDALPAALAAGAQVIAVRVWLLVRAEAPEVGFIDDRVYEYGDRLAANGVTADLDNPADAGLAFQASQSADNSPTSIKRFRRLLMSRTIQVRNALGT